jgi:hypothetical protein
MKQADLLKAMAIVNIFETGRPFGEFSAIAVLNDGAGISYGVNQFTHRSGSLAAVAERYLQLDGAVGRFVLENALVNLQRKEPVAIRAYSKDERVKKALRAAALTREMRIAQMQIAFEKYVKPAVDECSRLGFVLPLSLAVVYDSMTHGSYEKIRDHVGGIASTGLISRLSERQSHSANRAAEPSTDPEKEWVIEYVRERDRWLASIPRLNATRYRTRFFLNQIMLGQWELKLPLNVNGFWLRDAHIENILKFADETIGDDLAVGPASEHHTQSNNSINNPPNSSQNLTTTPQAQPPDLSGRLEQVETAAAIFDRVDNIVTGVPYRTDRAKSLWTTITGTIWQTVWAVVSFLIGLPRIVWLTVAVIAAVLMLFYLYRQITLGKLRELG